MNDDVFFINKEEGVSWTSDTPSFLFFHRFSSSDYAELTEHSCFTDTHGI